MKTFAVAVRGGEIGRARKIGEWPAFGARLPLRMKRLVGDDYELFMKGYRSENQGLGIGAFAYYRRVVETQKNRLFDEIIKASERLNASPKLFP